MWMTVETDAGMYKQCTKIRSVNKDRCNWRRAADVKKVWTRVYRHTAMVQYVIEQRDLDQGKKKPEYTLQTVPVSSVGIANGYGLDGQGDRIPVGARFSAPVQTGPGAHPASCTISTGSFPGVKSGRGVTLTLHTLLVPWSRKSRAIPLLPLWAVRPVQSLSACTRVHFTFITVYKRKHQLSAQDTVPFPVKLRT